MESAESHDRLPSEGTRHFLKKNRDAQHFFQYKKANDQFGARKIVDCKVTVMLSQHHIHNNQYATCLQGFKHVPYELEFCRQIYSPLQVWE